MKSLKIRILGGSFDPVHNGHLHIASQAIKKLHLDFIIFVPSFLPPHKKEKKDWFPPAFRLALLKKAIKGRKKMKIATHELRSKKVIYTVDSIKTIKKKFGSKNQYFLLLGSDWAGKFHTWKDSDEIVNQLEVVYFPRNEKPFTIEKKCVKIDIPVFEVSSTQIRDALIKHLDIRGLVPEIIRKILLNRYI